jgi:predicted DCC family thiol-disulfide oxidoreductase YuxK
VRRSGRSSAGTGGRVNRPARTGRGAHLSGGAAGCAIEGLERPLVIWDGECGFCRRSVDHLRARAGDRFDFEPYQSAAERFPDIPREAFAASVHLVEADGRVSRGAEAVYRALAIAGVHLPLLAHRRLPGFAAASEWGYRQVAAHRPLAARVLRLLVGDLVGPPRFRLTRFVFLRGLALVYVVAFLSLGVQVRGLVGEAGLLPAGDFLAWVYRLRGGEAFFLVPTLGWLGSGGTALSLLCYGGALAAALAAVGLSQGPLFALCFVLYLSLVHLGQTFLSFQWDVLLTEAGFLALLVAPWAHLRPRSPAHEPPPAPVAIWLLRFLLFKLMWGSGVTKLAWGDPTWRHLTALDYHYWTQPIPDALSWYASHLPAWLQRASCGFSLFVELVLPFLIFAPRRPRRIALWGFVVLQLGIAATGNYGFFNLLTIVLCIPLLDDDAFPRALGGGRWRAEASHEGLARPRRPLVAALAGILMLLQVEPLLASFDSRRLQRLEPQLLRSLSALASPFLISNSYGLFRTMTTTRPEIQLEGRVEDGDWTSLPFRYKPGDPARAPRFFAPHMPRLDWQMWFAALRAERLDPGEAAAGSWLEGEPWLGRLMLAVLRGDPDVLALLGPSPFAEGPPREVRLVLWQYRFTDHGPDWWRRRRVGVIAGPWSLPPSDPNDRR